MAAGLSTAANLKPYNLLQPPIPISKPTPPLFFNPLRCFRRSTILRVRPRRRRMSGFTVCVLTEDPKQIKKDEQEEQVNPQVVSARVAEKLARKKSQRFTYLVAAVMSSFGITSMAVFAVYYRFSWQMEGGDVPWSEMLGTFSLSVGAAVAMELWARWAHRALWHASLWHMHEGLGITVFGMAYMFVHDGLVHKRFPVGPIANVPYFRRVAAAHQLHHSDKFNGVPYGLFLGPKEVEEVGGLEELEKEISRRMRSGS
ncbi:Beta-carotene hydroxylase 1, chloroplastic [Glycine max]|nr:Beta-carotene hydroxylase 1, chloroplastic [Glycine max]